MGSPRVEKLDVLCGIVCGRVAVEAKLQAIDRAVSERLRTQVPGLVPHPRSLSASVMRASALLPVSYGEHIGRQEEQVSVRMKGG